MANPTPDLTSRIIAYENGEMGDSAILHLFADLVKTGLAFKLQGSYGRIACALIDAGYLSPDGELLFNPEN